MVERRLDLEAVAARIADGEPVDWDDAIRDATDESERRVVRQLRTVAAVAELHRSTEDETTETRHEPAPAAIGTWGPLELRARLGGGGFGEVYRAWDRRLDREVALKLLRQEATQGPAASAVVEEGRLLARLRHPSVVTVHGAEIHDGRVGIWMELIRGRSLEQLLQAQGPFGAREATLIGVDLCRALAAVHRAGVIHRDVKADNVMREEGGRIVLADFGAGVEASVERGPGRGSLSGTPLYMAPELFRGGPASPGTDMYALGVLLFRLVTASFPLEAPSWTELKARHARGEARLLRDERPDLPEAFVKIVERALAPEPEARFATAGQMEQALSLSLGTDSHPVERVAPPSRRPRLLGWSVAGAVVVAAAILVAVGPARVREALSLHESGAPVSYTVDAAFYRTAPGSGERERLEPGARLSLGDTLTLEVQSSIPLHVYVIDEDEAGHALALFPLPGFVPANPLPAGELNVLPGERDGQPLSWEVNTVGGREHLMVLASPTRLVEFEADMNALARPGQTAVAIPGSTLTRLRGIGGLSETSPPTPASSAAPLFDTARRLASRSERVQGVWLRQIDLENPPPP